MPLQTKQFYEFADFRLDLSEKVLLHDRSPIPLTPKVFDTLKLLVENPGHLLEKEELIQTIWPDRFVEESNLTFNIKMIRKALGDNAAEPRFIETVPRRGYRFIAQVREFSKETATANASARLFGDQQERKYFHYFTLRALLLSTAVLAAAAGLLGFWFARSRAPASGAPVLSAPFQSEKLSTNGKVFNAVISPDGRFVIYSYGAGSEKESIWLRQLESATNVEMIPPSDDIYSGLALSSDGNFLYFTRRGRNTGAPLEVYRVPIFGGVPIRLVGDTQGWLSLSPDGLRFSFVRCFYRDDEYCSLWLADSADGKNERMLTKRPRPFRIADNAISPDGKSVAFASGQSENQSNEFGLMQLDIETGAERELTREKFFNIKSLAWLPDGSGLLVTAAKIPNKNFRIWHISAATGYAEPLTKDSETYSALSLDRAARRLVATQVRQGFQLRVFESERPFNPQLQVDATHADFAPSGNIVFSSTLSGNDEIWSINSDGSGQKQLTNNPADDSRPVVSPGSGLIFFASNRTGQVHVWRMNADGSGLTQITRTVGGFPLFVSPDGKWLYYHHGIDRTLWRVAAAGGDEQLVLDKKSRIFEFSPDGSTVAFPEVENGENILAVAAIADGQIIKRFRVAGKTGSLQAIDWSADGKSLAYASADDEYSNNMLWIQSLDGAAPKLMADLGSEEINDLRFSPTGDTFALVSGGWKHDAVLISGLR